MMQARLILAVVYCYGGVDRCVARRRLPVEEEPQRVEAERVELVEQVRRRALLEAEGDAQRSLRAEPMGRARARVWARGIDAVEGRADEMRRRCAPVDPAQCERLVVAVQTAAIHPEIEHFHSHSSMANEAPAVRFFDEETPIKELFSLTP